MAPATAGNKAAFPHVIVDFMSTTAPLELFNGVVPFVAAADAGSIRGAARELGVTPSAVTKAIQRLEARLGVRLMMRTSRRITPTVEGEAILACYRDAVARGLAAQDLALTAQRRPQGVLRASASRVLGREVLAPAMPRLLERYPRLSLQLSFTDRLVSFADENVDVVVRIGRLEDSDAKRWRLAETRWTTVASPAYLARRGAPASPEDLASHDCLRFLAPDGRPRDWAFAGRDGSTGVVRVDGPVVVDDGESLMAAAEAGAGLVQAMDFMVARPIAQGRLIEVLRTYSTRGPSISALAAPGRHGSPRVRAFVGFLEDTFQRLGAS